MYRINDAMNTDLDEALIFFVRSNAPLEHRQTITDHLQMVRTANNALMTSCLNMDDVAISRNMLAVTGYIAGLIKNLQKSAGETPASGELVIGTVMVMDGLVDTYRAMLNTDLSAVVHLILSTLHDKLSGFLSRISGIVNAETTNLVELTRRLVTVNKLANELDGLIGLQNTVFGMANLRL